jgi:hypothetical protein
MARPSGGSIEPLRERVVGRVALEDLRDCMIRALERPALRNLSFRLGSPPRASQGYSTRCR